MKTIFVSGYNVDEPPASNLIAALRFRGLSVEYSPSNPKNKPDSKWENWYEEGLMAALQGCDTFVAVVTDAWDSSSWMYAECQVALNLLNASQMPRLFYWNPQKISVTAAGMVRFLKSELPLDPDVAVEVLTQ